MRSMTRFAPSKVWFGFATFLWKRVATRDRFLVLSCLLLPAANRISTLVAFGITIKSINRAVRGELGSSEELLLGGAVVGAFVLSEILSVLAARADVSMHRVALALSRELRADELIRLRERGVKTRRESLEHLEGSEKDPALAAALLIQNLVRFASLIFLVVSLLLVIGIISPLVSGFIALGGGILLLFLRLRIRPSLNREQSRKLARRQLASMECRLLAAEDVDKSVVANYLRNAHDRILFEAAKAKRRREGKVVALAGGGAALAMVSVFFLVSRGHFDGVDPATLVVLILSLRLCVSQGKMAVEKWSRLLSDKVILSELRKTAEHSAQRAFGQLGTPYAADVGNHGDLDLRRQGPQSKAHGRSPSA